MLLQETVHSVSLTIYFHFYNSLSFPQLSEQETAVFLGLELVFGFTFVDVDDVDPVLDALSVLLIDFQVKSNHNMTE